MVTHNRRIAHEDLIEALGPVEKRKGVVVYICGPPGMRNGFVEVMGGQRGWIAGGCFTRSGGEGMGK